MYVDFRITRANYLLLNLFSLTVLFLSPILMGIFFEKEKTRPIITTSLEEIFHSTFTLKSQWTLYHGY